MTAPTTLHEHGKNCRHRSYYLTCEAFDMLLGIAGGHCQVCGKPGIRTLVIDHDHGCYSRVRGLICQACNIRLGRIDGGRRAPNVAERAYLDAPFHAQLSDSHFIPAKRRATSRTDVAVRLDPDTSAAVNRLAKDDDRSRSQMMGILIREALKAREEKEQGK